MARAATAFVDFEGDFSKVGHGAGAQAKKLEGTFNSSFKRIAGFAAASLATIGIGRVLKDAFKQAEEAQKVGKLTAAVLKSTGGVAKVSAKQIETMSNSLSALSGIDDEVIQSGENVLLTFTNIKNEAGKGNDVFNQATEAALNLSSALGQDMQSSVIQLGKALNDPIKGVTALQRVGVSFTKDQKEQIKTLVESGKTLDAQKLILKELTTEFGGAAAAAATPSAKLGVAFNNIKESIGGIVLPVFEKLASFITVTAAPAIKTLVDTMKTLGSVAKLAFQVGFSGKSIAGIHGWLAVFSKLGAVIRGFVDFIHGDVASAGVQLGKLFGLQEDDPNVKGMIKALSAIRKAIVPVVEFIQKHWKPILIAAAVALGLLVSPIATVVIGLAVLYGKFKVVRDIVTDVVGAIEAAGRGIQAVIEGVVGFFQSHAQNFAAFGKQFEAIGKSFVDVWNAIVPLVKAALTIVVGVIAGVVIVIVALWDRFGKTILDKVRIAFNAVATIVRGALQIVQGIIEIVTGIITLKWGKVWNGLKDVFGGVWLAIVGIAQFAINQTSAVIALGVSAITGAWSAAWGGFQAVVAGIWGGIERTIGSAVNVIIDIINGLIGAFNRIPGWLRPGTSKIDKLDHVHWAEPSVARHTSGKTHAFHTGGIVPGTGDVLALVKGGEGIFTQDQMQALGSSGGPKVDARTIVQGNVYGDSHLRKVLTDHDERLALALRAG